MKKSRMLFLVCLLILSLMVSFASCNPNSPGDETPPTTDGDSSNGGSNLGIGVGSSDGINLGDMGFDSIEHYEPKVPVVMPENPKDEGTKTFYRMEVECAELLLANGEVFNDFRHLGFDLRLSGGFATRNANLNGTEITFTFNSDAAYSGVTLRMMISIAPGMDTTNVAEIINITNNGWSENDPALVIEKSKCEQLGHNSYMIFTVVETEITVQKGENKLKFEYLKASGGNIDYIEIGTSAGITGFDNTKYWEDKNATYEIINNPTAEATGTLRLTTLNAGETGIINYTLPTLSTDNGYSYEKVGTKETWSFKVKNQVFEIVHDPDATYTLTLAENCGLTFADGATSVQLKEGESLPALVGNTTNLAGYYNVDNLEQRYPADFVMGKKNITIAPFYAISSEHQWLDFGITSNTLDGHPVSYGEPQIDLSLCSSIASVVKGGKTTLLNKGTLSTTNTVGVNQFGKTFTYSGSLVVGQTFRFQTSVNTETAVITTGTAHEFVYNFENKGEGKISLTVYQVNSKTSTEDEGVVIELDPGESMTVVYTIAFTKGGNNKNALTYFTVNEAMDNGLSLGVSMSVCPNVKEHVHSYDTVTTHPTCTEQGYTTYTCGCGDSYVDDYVNSTGHSWNDGQVTTEPTCSAEGEKTITCDSCGATDTVEIAINDNAHAWDEGEITTQPTCTEKGVKTYTCIHDNAHTKPEDVAAKGHTDENGDYICDVEDCGMGLCLNHEAGEAVVENNVPATCESAGSYNSVVYCNKCNAEISSTPVTVDALGHVYKANVTAPTCEAQGYTTYICQNDNTHTYVEDYVNALGHDYEAAITTEPTGNEAGVRTYTCKNDASHTYTEAVYKLSASEGSGITLDGESAVYLKEGDALPEIAGTAANLLGYYNVADTSEAWSVADWYTVMPAKNITFAPYYAISDEHQWLDVGSSKSTSNYVNTAYGDPVMTNDSFSAATSIIAGGKTTFMKNGVLSTSEDVGIVQLGRVITYTGEAKVGQGFRFDSQADKTLAPVVIGATHEFVYNFENKGTETIYFTVYQVNTNTKTEDDGVDVVLAPGESMTVVYQISFANGSNNKNVLTYVAVKQDMANGFSLGVSASFNDRIPVEKTNTLTLQEGCGLTFEDGSMSKQVYVGSAFPKVIGNNADLVLGYYNASDVSNYWEEYYFVMPDSDLTVAPDVKISDEHQWLNFGVTSNTTTGLPVLYGTLKDNPTGSFTSTVSFVKGGKTTIREGENLSTLDTVGVDQLGKTINYDGALEVDQTFRFQTNVSSEKVVKTGVTHEFVYNFENKGEGKISFTIYQVNSKTSTEDEGVVIELDPGESMTVVYRIAFANGSDNNNAMLYFKVKEAMANGMSLGISASVKLGQ